MADLAFVRVYTDDLIIVTKDCWEIISLNYEQYFSDLEMQVSWLMKKYFFGRTELEYLSYWITRDGDQPLQKIQATLIIKKYGWLPEKEAETIP